MSSLTSVNHYAARLKSEKMAGFEDYFEQWFPYSTRSGALPDSYRDRGSVSLGNNRWFGKGWLALSSSRLYGHTARFNMLIYPINLNFKI
ncbi:MAG: hypothetical protein ABI688_08555 [Bacteroidota bacterium]